LHHFKISLAYKASKSIEHYLLLLLLLLLL